MMCTQFCVKYVVLYCFRYRAGIELLFFTLAHLITLCDHESNLGGFTEIIWMVNFPNEDVCIPYIHLISKILMMQNLMK